MDLEAFLNQADELGWLHHVQATVNPYLEMARVIYSLHEELALFECVTGSSFRVAAGVCSQQRYLAKALGIEESQLMDALRSALRQPLPSRAVNDAPCQQVVEPDVNLNCLPILTHFAEDGGPYITSGVAVVCDPDLGRNLSFHRLMQVDAHRMTIRLVEGRGLYTTWTKAKGPLPVVMCLGAPAQVQLAAAMSPRPGMDEMAIANALSPTPTVKALTCNLEIPAETEIVLEGYLTRETSDEGPFIDLTRTRDFVRQQPFFVIEKITHRTNAIFQALLPGGEEHRLLMGLPRVPTIFEAVNQVCRCLHVSITSGGGHWLHAVVQIDKQHPDDGLKAIEAAFRGHNSLKHVVIVDRDINPEDMSAVEWSIATRFQAGKGLVVLNNQPSSSLDPSATHVPGAKARTSKMGLDATIPWDTPAGPLNPADFTTVTYEPINLQRFLGTQG
ncbi:MAG: UbiD family decarboxylase [Chloroflexi bacterium]|nr:UbiD family decarboxylase [Chloroflexota bacterium]